jgi:L-asparaginase
VLVVLLSLNDCHSIQDCWFVQYFVQASDSPMQAVVILGTGGTIAGTNDDPSRAWHYRAAQLTVEQLVQAVPALEGMRLETQQVAQVDSKDMSWAIWRQLAQALAMQLARDDVAGVVVAHGTDTLEETGQLLHQLSDGRKPIVLTAAMRPATASDADGPRNLRDAVRVVQEAAQRGLGGVVAVMQGKVWAGAQVRKVNSCALDAFDAGGEAPLAVLHDDGMWLMARPWQASGQWGWGLLDAEAPRVEIITSHAGADGWLVDAALARSQPESPLRGLVVACTGHGTIHAELEAALQRAEAVAVRVWRSTRVARGGVQGRDGDHWPATGALTPAQARVALMLAILKGD